MDKFKTIPLRFRAWDKRQKRIRGIEEIDFAAQEVVPIDGSDVIPFSEAVISQDTGLKDKNGKSIYTGDIVRWPISTNKKRYHYVSIVYRDGKVMYDHGPDFGSPISRYEETALIFEDELVGNIWQNPELLEEE